LSTLSAIYGRIEDAAIHPKGLEPLSPTFMSFKTLPTILALDFDGVICDGMLEYFQSTWRTYCKIWQPVGAIHESPLQPPEGLEPSFARLRPVIETGWEMPVLIRSLIQGISEAEILADWHSIAQQIVEQENLNQTELAKILDQTRDKWIQDDLSGWLSLHRFYPGVVETLKWAIAQNAKAFTTNEKNAKAFTTNEKNAKAFTTNPMKTVIITTKEGRFVKQLLQQQGVDLGATEIFGKECQRPKHQIIRELIGKATGKSVVWFVEDRIKTLRSVQQQPDLTEVKLYLADWGYNTEGDRTLARETPGIQLISLSQFSADLANWP
jgi:hypothetical protein